MERPLWKEFYPSLVRQDFRSVRTTNRAQMHRSPVGLRPVDWTRILIWCFAGTERLCDRGHSRGTGVLRLPDNQGLPGLSPGETEAVVGTHHV